MFKFGDDLTKENIEILISSYQIFKFYYPNLELRKTCNSPFREDKTPSFGLFVSKVNDEVLYNDLGSSDSGNWVKFIRKLLDLNYHEALSLVNRDFDLGLMDSTLINQKVPKRSSIAVSPSIITIKHKELILNVQKRPWYDHDYLYWESYGITADLLKDTHAISSYWFNNWQTVLVEPHAYCFDFYRENGIMKRKIYQPFSVKNKWKTNLNSLVIDGIKDIPKHGDLLIITKSRKDRLVLSSLGYNAIATNNESSWIPNINYNKLRARFTNIVIFFDNDEAGIQGATKFSNQFELPYISIPKIENTRITDIADYRKRYGRLATIKVLDYLLKQLKL